MTSLEEDSGESLEEGDGAWGVGRRCGGGLDRVELGSDVCSRR